MCYTLRFLALALSSADVKNLNNDCKYLQSCRGSGLNWFLLSLRNSMSNLRPGRAENRRSVFYTGNSEEWELVEAPPKDFPDQKHHLETQRRKSTLIHPGLPGALYSSRILPTCAPSLTQILLGRRSPSILCGTVSDPRGFCFET